MNLQVETIGDGYMVVAGHDGAGDHAQRMMAMAADMLHEVRAARYKVQGIQLGYTQLKDWGGASEAQCMIGMAAGHACTM